MRFRRIAPLVTALILIVFASSCRRVMSPQADSQGSIREALTGILQIRWPSGTVSAPIRIRLTNDHEILNPRSPVRQNYIVLAYSGGEFVIEDLFSTTYMMEFSWATGARHAQSWIFGPLAIGGATTPIDLRASNLDLTPRLRADGVEVPVKEVQGSARTTPAGNSVFIARSEGDSTLAFRVPPGDTELSFGWTIDGPTYGPKGVSAKLTETFEVPGALITELNLSRIYLRVNTRLVTPANWAAAIRVDQSTVGDWSSVSSDSNWRPGEIVSLLVGKGPFQFRATLPYRWRDLTPSPHFWAEVAPGDTLDLDLGVLTAELRILDAGGSPVVFAPVQLEPVSPGFDGELGGLTDGKGEVSYLLNPGAYDFTVEKRWTRRFTLIGDTLIVITEEP